MKRFFGAFVSLGFLLVVPLTVSAACSPVALGGTGQCTFTQGLLYSAGGTNPFLTTSTTTLVAGTNISFGGATPVILGSSPITISSSGGSGGTGNVSTSTHETAGQIAYWTSNSGTPALLGEEATSAVTISAPLTTSGTQGYVLGGSSWTIGCQTASGSQAGCLSSSDWTTFNGKQAAGTYLTALGNYATTTGTAISFSTSTQTFQGAIFGQKIVMSANAVLFTPNITGTLTAASSTLLSNNNTFSGNNLFSASTTIGGGSVTTGLTVNGTATSTAQVVTGLTSALGLYNATHQLTAYGGASSCSANNFFTGLSAVGASTCGTASVTVNTTAPLGGGGAVSLGSTLTLTCGTCTTGGVTSVTATAPIFSTGGTTPIISWAGLATSTNLVAAQVLFASAAGTVAGNTSFTFTTAGNTLLTVTNASDTSLTTNYFNVSNPNATTTIASGVVVATTSPNAFVVTDGFGTQQLVDQTASTTGVIFAVSATTTGNPILFSEDQYGHLTASSTRATPSISSCGTGSPVMGTNANDAWGSFTTGTSASSCTITFASAYSSTPIVVISDSNTSAVADVSSISTTAFTVSLASALSTVTVYYMVGMP